MKNYINRMVEKVIDLTKVIRIKKEFKLLLISVFLCLFFLGGVSPLYAGWYTVTADNNTGLAWGDFHFEIIPISGQTGPLYNISNVFFDVVYDPPETDHRPQSSQTLDPDNMWTLSSDSKKIDLNFYAHPFGPGETNGTWTVFINNPDGVIHGVTSYPSVVPEPVSSTLFILGGATLGYRRYMKNKRKS